MAKGIGSGTDKIFEGFKRFPLFKLMYRLSWAPRVYHFSLALFGALLYRFPSRKLTVIGVTGTKGKTTTVELLNAALEASGKKTAVLSSLRIKIGGRSEKNTFGNTMPGRCFVQHFLREAVREKCAYAVMEVTSQGVVLSRHRFIDWDAAAFLNLAPEHIESHGSFEAYRAAKVAFFASLARSAKRKRFFFVNGNDSNARYFEEAARKVPRSTLLEVDRSTAEKTFPLRSLAEENPWFAADFNQDDAVMAVTIGEAFGVSAEAAWGALLRFRGVPGRLEYVQREPFAAVVDYAHTPDSLEKVYRHLKNQELKVNGKKLICVLGSAGGGRDVWKRPEMGKIAARYCDEIILTTEDPYHEPTEKIMEAIAAGIPAEDRAKVHMVADRREAIRRAVASARRGDMVVATGKGSENSIHFAGGRKEPWDERKEIENALAILTG